MYGGARQIVAPLVRSLVRYLGGVEKYLEGSGSPPAIARTGRAQAYRACTPGRARPVPYLSSDSLAVDGTPVLSPDQSILLSITLFPFLIQAPSRFRPRPRIRRRLVLQPFSLSLPVSDAELTFLLPLLQPGNPAPIILRQQQSIPTPNNPSAPHPRATTADPTPTSTSPSTSTAADNQDNFPATPAALSPLCRPWVSLARHAVEVSDAPDVTRRLGRDDHRLDRADASLGRSRDGLYEPVLADSEREAVADLLQYLENRGETDFFSGEPLRALSTLVFSENIDLQRSASLTFAEITERDVREVDRDTLEPILFLLQSPDIEVQRAASAALGNLAVDTENKVLIVQLGGLTPLIRQMMSPNVEVQCNAVGCITNLATHEENKAKIARSGALGPLTRLAKSRDMRVQRNATGALLNMTHSDENRQQLVNAGAIPVLVQLLSSPDVDVQYYCTTALSNIAVDASNRRKLAQSEPKLVQSLVNLMDSTSPKVQCQAALALRNLASDEKYQLDIVRANGLHPLLRLLQSSYLPLILSAVACIRNISIHPMNESPIIETNFLKPLVDLLGSTDNEEIQCHAISTLRNLAASSDRNKALVLDAGAVQKCKQLVLDVPVTVQSEMTAAIAVLALSDDLKSHLLNLGVCSVLIPLTHSPSIEVQGNSAAALGNLSSKVGDYSIFVQNWTEPNGGIHGYLCRFLQSGDATFQHIAVWTLLQLFESEDKTLIGLIGKAEDIIEHIRTIANRQIEPENEFEDEDEGEVVNLAQRCLELLGQSMSKAHIEG
ncbi:hypothetical protein G7Z17_g12955 [Cylindrodendrum hubeiense]|uniref:Vacuolar protein 8 n=1 Tax=Cylindrodendrum hubeiense TaxID=595255 RepID=A0A9P5L8R0_9HYPO|nr:hypothetical protein G7Z17_g12955 [Cylindrodendrum hubeiense]